MSVKQLSFCKYELTPKSRIGAIATGRVREGVLLKVVNVFDEVGYADLFYWPELGDAPLDEQLQAFKNGHVSPVLRQSLMFAERDAEARKNQLGLMPFTPQLRNHLLVSDPTLVTDQDLVRALSCGYTRIKLKCGVQPQSEIEFIKKAVLENGFILRLDFNSSSSPGEFTEFAAALPEEVRAKIEFVEDPFPFEMKSWQFANGLLPLAVDHEIKNVDWQQSLPFEVIILKPARQNVAEILEIARVRNLKIAITSSLDHTLGILHTAALAEEIKSQNPGLILEAGCFSHMVYEPDAFSSQLPLEGPYLAGVQGYGIGFDSQLAGLPWWEM